MHAIDDVLLYAYRKKLASVEWSADPENNLILGQVGDIAMDILMARENQFVWTVRCMSFEGREGEPKLSGFSTSVEQAKSRCLEAAEEIVLPAITFLLTRER